MQERQQSDVQGHRQHPSCNLQPEAACASEPADPNAADTPSNAPDLDTQAHAQEPEAPTRGPRRLRRAPSSRGKAAAAASSSADGEGISNGSRSRPSPLPPITSGQQAGASAPSRTESVKLEGTPPSACCAYPCW
jgi:hypothetical protein